MFFLPVRVELPLDVTIERPHHAYPGEHRRATALSDRQRRFHRGLPFCGIVFGLGELRDVVGGVAEVTSFLPLGNSIGSKNCWSHDIPAFHVTGWIIQE